jgi:hypothetical protein
MQPGALDAADTRKWCDMLTGNAMFGFGSPIRSVIEFSRKRRRPLRRSISAVVEALETRQLLSANLVADPGFESSASLSPSWVQSGPAGGVGVDSGNGHGHSGNNCGYIFSPGNFGTCYLVQMVTVSPNTSYNFSAFLQSGGLTSNAGQILVTTTGGTILSSANYSNTTSYQQISAPSFNSGSNTQVEIKIGYTTPASGSSFIHADDVSLSTASTDSGPVVVTPASAIQNPNSNSSIILSVLGANPDGDPDLTYIWATTGTPPSAPNFGPAVGVNNGEDNALAVVFKAGTYNFQVTIEDSAGRTTTSSVSFTVQQVLSNITVTPGTASVPLGGTKQFTAAGTDQFGDPLLTPPTLTWSNSGSGSINSSGLYTASSTTGGTDTVKATSGAVSGTAIVSVGSVNLVQDPGFESSTSLSPNWVQSGPAGGVGVDSGNGHGRSGNNCGYIFSPGNFGTCYLVQTINIPTTALYNFSAWVQSSGLAANAGQLLVTTTSGKVLAVISFSGSANYQQVSTNALVLAANTQVQIKIGYTTPTTGSSYIHIDDVSLVGTPLISNLLATSIPAGTLFSFDASTAVAQETFLRSVNGGPFSQVTLGVNGFGGGASTITTSTQNNQTTSHWSLVDTSQPAGTTVAYEIQANALKNDGTQVPLPLAGPTAAVVAGQGSWVSTGNQVTLNPSSTATLGAEFGATNQVFAPGVYRVILVSGTVQSSVTPPALSVGNTETPILAVQPLYTGEGDVYVETASSIGVGFPNPYPGGTGPDDPLTYELQQLTPSTM